MKCRWCNFTVLKWRTLPDGKKISGWPALSRHVESEHEDEFAEVLKKLPTRHDTETACED
jgi:hypothetical protein